MSGGIDFVRLYLLLPPEGTSAPATLMENVADEKTKGVHTPSKRFQNMLCCFGVAWLAGLLCTNKHLKDALQADVGFMSRPAKACQANAKTATATASQTSSVCVRLFWTNERTHALVLPAITFAFVK